MSYRNPPSSWLPNQMWGEIVDVNSCCSFEKIGAALKGVAGFQEEASEKLAAAAALSAKSAQAIAGVRLRMEKIERLLASLKDAEEI